MNTNQVSLTRTILNVTTPSNQGINFAQGEVVKGVVQEVKPDGMVMITIKGQTIEAMTEVPVQPGQQLYLKVDDFRDGKTFLKVVTPQAMEVIENANLSANLLDMGIPAKEENIAMARKLLDYNMPVTANNLNEMAKGVKLLGSATPISLEIVAFVMSRNLPVDAATLKALEQYTLPDSNIAKLVQSVMQSLRELGQSNMAQFLAPGNTAAGGANPAGVITVADAEVATSFPPNLSEGNSAAAPASTGGTAAANAGSSSSTVTAGPAMPASPEPGSPTATVAPLPDAMAKAPITLEEGMEAPMPANPRSTSEAARPPAGTAPGNNPPADASGGPISTPSPANNSNKPTAMPGAPVAPEASAPESQGVKAGNQPIIIPSAPPLPEATTGESQGVKAGSQPTIITSAPPLPEATIPESQGVKAGSQPALIPNAPPLPETAEVANLAGNSPAQVSDEAGGEKTPSPGNPLPNNTVKEEPAAANRALANSPEVGSSRTTVTPGNQPLRETPGGTPLKTDGPVFGDMKPVALPNEEPVAKNTAVTAGAKNEGSSNTAGFMARPTETITGNAGDAPRTVASAWSDLINSANRAAVEGGSTTAANAENTAAGPGRLGEQLNLLRTLIEWMQVDGREPAAEIGQKLERSVASDKDVIRGLTLLQDVIKSDNAQSRSPAVHELLQRIDNLEKELSGQKMFNYLSRTSTDNQFNFYYFSIPVKVGGETHQCQLRFNKEGRRDLRNADNLSFIVSLDTGKMGMVLFHVNWQRSGSLALQGVVENDGVARYLSDNMPGLLGKLGDLGYSVQNLGIKVAEEQIDESLKIRVEEAPLAISPLGIDITV